MIRKRPGKNGTRYEPQVCEDDGTNTVEITAAELDTNDIFPSHDGLRHDVDGVSVTDDTVSVNVRRSDGSRYSVDFPAEHRVRVLTYP